MDGPQKNHLDYFNACDRGIWSCAGSEWWFQMLQRNVLLAGRTGGDPRGNGRQSGSGCLRGRVLEYDSRVYLNEAEREMCDYNF